MKTAQVGSIIERDWTGSRAVILEISKDKWGVDIAKVRFTEDLNKKGLLGIAQKLLRDWLK